MPKVSLIIDSVCLRLYFECDARAPINFFLHASIFLWASAYSFLLSGSANIVDTLSSLYSFSNGIVT